MAGKTVITTKAEALYLWRRRQAGMSQTLAAAALGVGVDIYRDWETGRRDHDVPQMRKRLGALKPCEVCAILRRREGLTQRQLAKLMGCTRLWVLQMEAGNAPDDRLREHWGV